MKKSFKKLLGLISIVCTISIAMFVVGCSSKATNSGTTTDVSKKYVLKLGTNTATSNAENQFALKLSELVKQKTNGNVDIQVYDSAKLGDHKERLEGLKMGTIDMTQTSVGYMAAYEPIMAMFESPYLFKDEIQQNHVYNGQVGKQIADTLSKDGYIVIQYMELGERDITNSKKPIKTPSDLAGLKLRVPDTQSSIDALKAMGASPTPMAFAELYMSLQQKVVDGQENPLDTTDSSKFYEVQKYLSLTGHQRLEQVLLFSKMNWEKLPKEYQTIILDSAKEANDYLIKLVSENKNKMLDDLKSKGMQVNEVDMQAFMDKVKPLRDKYITQFGSQAKSYFEEIDNTK